MFCPFLPSVYGWMMTLLWWRWASVCVPPYADLIIAIIAVWRWTVSPHMGLTVVGVRSALPSCRIERYRAQGSCCSKNTIRLKPSGLYHADGKCPDCITLVPWKSGGLLVWDVTCPDTFDPSYTSIATKEARAVAMSEEERKKAK